MPAELSGHCANLYHTNSQVEDHASATGLFPNGVHFTMNFSVATHGDSSRVDLFGSAGAVMLQDGKFARYIRYEQDLVDFARSYGGPNPYGSPPAREQPLPEVPEAQEGLLHSRFAEAVLTRKKDRLLVSAAEGMWSQQTINATILSSYLGKKVKLPVSPARYEKMLADLIANAPPVQRQQRQSAEGMAAF
jgi:predicted dehydrogenase